MLLGDFYTVENKEMISPEIQKFQVVINPTHPIFQGHFPNQPVVPGVCLTQIGKELLESMVERKLLLKKGDNIKFLHVVDPNIHPRIQVEVKIKSQDGGKIGTDFSISSEATTFFKFSGLFQ